MTISAHLFSSEERLWLSTRTSLVTACATLLGLHSAIELYDPSLMTLMLGLCSAFFLWKAFNMCKKELSVQLSPDEPTSNEYFRIEISETEPKSFRFLVRFRGIAFLLSIMSAVAFIVLCRLCSFQQVVYAKWWQGVAMLTVIESGRWMLICFLV